MTHEEAVERLIQLAFDGKIPDTKAQRLIGLPDRRRAPSTADLEITLVSNTAGFAGARRRLRIQRLPGSRSLNFKLFNINSYFSSWNQDYGGC